MLSFPSPRNLGKICNEKNQTIFQDFGLTVLDECHHLSAEVFSRALFKIVTKYMLGLSATMNRKDGLTKVFKMFIGDVVYKKKRENSNLTVKVIKYKNNDEDYGMAYITDGWVSREDITLPTTCKMKRPKKS